MASVLQAPVALELRAGVRAGECDWRYVSIIKLINNNLHHIGGVHESVVCQGAAGQLV